MFKCKCLCWETKSEVPYFEELYRFCPKNSPKIIKHQTFSKYTFSMMITSVGLTKNLKIKVLFTFVITWFPNLQVLCKKPVTLHAIRNSSWSIPGDLNKKEIQIHLLMFNELYLFASCFFIHIKLGHTFTFPNILLV